MKNVLFTAVLFVIGWASKVAGEDQPLSKKILERVRAATVLINVDSNSDQSSGSGFLVQTTGSTGYIVTNSHVCAVNPLTGKGAKISVVFHSGTPSEAAFAGEVVTESADADLAILKITGTKLPQPLEVGKVEIRETTSVIVVGFPFGQELALDDRNPTVTLSKATVSSLRRHTANRVSLIQLDGNLNPGNSGGPVVDHLGQLVGIAVARIDNAGIGFAIPSETLGDVLRGDVNDVLLVSTPGSETVKVQCRLLDPFGKIKSVSVRFQKPGDPQDPGPMPMDALSRVGQLASGIVPVPTTGSLVVDALLEVVLTDGTVVRREPVSVEFKNGLLKDNEFRWELFESVDALGKSSEAGAQYPARQAKLEGDITFVAPAPDGSGMYVISKTGTQQRLQFWDLGTNELRPEIRVPKSPSHLRTQGDRLIVTCTESSVAALIDPTKNKIAASVELDTDEKLQPTRLGISSVPNLAYVLSTVDSQNAITEIDLQTRRTRTLTHETIQHAVVTPDAVVLQSNFGGSPSGIPTIYSPAVQPDGKLKLITRGEHQDYGPFSTTSQGRLVTTNADEKTVCVSNDLKETYWTSDGVLIASYPDMSTFLLTTGARLTNTDKWPLKAVDQNGTTLWEEQVSLEIPVSLWISQAIPFNNSPQFLIIGTLHEGNALQVGLGIIPIGISRSYVLSGPNDDHVLFCVSKYAPQVQGRYALRVTEEAKVWFSAKLPRANASSQNRRQIPDHVIVGSTFRWQPELPQSAGRYVVKTGPEGMTCDPQTGDIEWTADEASVGKYDIEIVDQENEKEVSVLKFGLRVRSIAP